MFQQQGQPTHPQALLEQHHRAAAQQAAQQQNQRQTMAALSIQPPSWGMPQQSTSAQTATPATGATSQGQQPWGMTMPQQSTSAQTASHTMFGAMQAQQASAMHSLMAQQGAMTHHLPTQSTQPSGQQLFPQTSHFPTPSPTANPLANLFVQQQQHTTPTFSMSSTTRNPQSNTAAEALSLTHLAQNMGPTARKQLIQLLASHEPSLTSVGGSATAALQHLQQSQQSQPPLQPPSHISQPAQTQTHVPTATTDTTAVDALRSKQKAPTFHTHLHPLRVTTTQAASLTSQPHTAPSQPGDTQQFPCAPTSTPTPTKEQYFVQKTQQASTTAFTQVWSQTTIIPTIEIHQTQQARGALPAIKACHVEKQISTRPFYFRTTRRE